MIPASSNLPSPFHAAAAVPSTAGFTNDLAAHLEPGGIVVSCPAFFLLARPVPRAAPVDSLTNPWRRWPGQDCDAWMIWLAAGSLLKALESLVPVFGPREWIAFQTDGPPRFWRMRSLHAWLRRGLTAPPASSVQNAPE